MKSFIDLLIFVVYTCEILRVFEYTLSDVWFRNLSQHAVKPVVKIGMSHPVSLKCCWHSGIAIKWVCRVKLTITKEWFF